MDGDANASMHAKEGGAEPGGTFRGETNTPRAAVDGRVAQRIRQARLRRGLSQNELAKAMNLSLQQVHKYETARNRIGAARLAQVAEVLGVDMDWLFDDPAGGRAHTADGSSRECLELVRNFHRVPDRSQRAAFLALLRAMAENSGEPPDGAG